MTYDPGLVQIKQERRLVWAALLFRRVYRQRRGELLKATLGRWLV